MNSAITTNLFKNIVKKSKWIINGYNKDLNSCQNINDKSIF